MSDKNKAMLRLLAIGFVVAAFAYSGVSFWRSAATSRGSEKDEVILVCAKCDQETVLPSAEYRKLPRDPQTGGIQCPKCRRAIPAQPHGSPLACPFCKASFVEDDEGESPPPMHKDSPHR